MKTIKVGARGSDLSLTQTGWLLDQLKQANPGLETEIVIIKTLGDRDQKSKLEDLGPPGGFTTELERALLDEQVDMAVHSLKDMPTEITPALTIAAIPKRAPAHDVLLTRQAVDINALPDGFAIGTSSPRREMQIKRHALGVVTKPIRGNVPGRIAKLVNGDYDGIILAAAGLERLGLSHENQYDLPLKDFPTAPGQGALSAQARTGSEVAKLLQSIDDQPTRAAVTAERAFLSATGGGCHTALGAFGQIENHLLILQGQLFADGHLLAGQVTGSPDEPEQLGRELFETVQRCTSV